MSMSIDQLLLFLHITLFKKDEEKLKTYLTYELSSYPLSLFNAGGTLKAKESTLYPIFPKIKSQHQQI